MTASVSGMVGRVGVARRGRALIAVGVVAVLVAGCTTTSTGAAVWRAPAAGEVASSTAAATPSAATSGAGGFQAGAAGLADPYYPLAGNGGYDVASYALEISYDPVTDRLGGREVITASATANLASFDLDLHGLDITSIAVDGRPAGYRRDADELIITPARGLAQGARFRVEIRYGGVPTGYHDDELGELGFLATADGAIAQGQPQVAASWYPVNDHPRDKATYTIAITVPDGLSALSNGVLTGRKSAGAGRTTWTWVEDSPMASYLATVLIGRYRVHESTHNGRPVLTAVHSSEPETIDAQLARTPEIVDYLATQFGPYPFDALGGIVHNDSRFGFALENQSRPVYAPSFFVGGGDASWVIVHELAHQWFGDSVSVWSWSDIWLNEGFATYAEWLWREHAGGRTAQQSFDDAYRSRPNSAWRVRIGDPGPADLFDEAVYDRGAMTLHALRVTVGEEIFFKIVKSWAADRRDGNGDTAGFIALAERLAGRSLGDLFDRWLNRGSRPPYPG